MLFLLSCSNGINKDEKPGSADSSFMNESITTDRKNSTDTINQGNLTTGQAWIQLGKEFKDKPAGSGDVAFKRFLEMHEKALHKLNEKHKESAMNGPLADAIVSKRKLTPAQKLFVDSVAAIGFAIETGEGMSYLVRDWSFFMDQPISFLSPAVRTFIVQMNKDEKQGFAKDAS